LLIISERYPSIVQPAADAVRYQHWTAAAIIQIINSFSSPQKQGRAAMSSLRGGAHDRCFDSGARERCTPGAGDGEIVDVNVGGVHFATTRHTLCSALEPRSMLAAMFADGGLPSRTDRHGCVFIDRDGGRFRLILNYLRSGTVHCDPDRTALSELLEEAEYFGTFTFS
jgi:hypothetical protein